MSNREFRLLFVDDDRDVRETFHAIFLPVLAEKYRIVPTVLEDGKAAEQLFSSGQRYDLVICDYNMPGKTGLDVFKTAVAAQPDIAFVLFSAFLYDGPDHRVLLYESDLKPHNLYLCLDKNWSLLKEMIGAILDDADRPEN